ncbi:MAG TPA: SRPBCC family protein [Burkholderiaceae bacterium]|nr:SRPBCC family protein [Burkholderiaceae bacterium]
MTKVYVSTVVNAPRAQVWQRVRDFNGLPAWHPGVADSRIEGDEPSDRPGCVRAFRFHSGNLVRERLLGLCDHTTSCRYTIVETALPVQNYIATLRLLPITDGDRTFVEWSADFDCPPDSQADVADRLGNAVFGRGLAGLRASFES